MTARRLAAISLSFCFALSVSAAFAGPQTEGSLAILADNAAKQGMAGGKCKAVVVGVEDNGVRVMRFYGDTGNIGAPRANTEFEIGSITKTFTAMILALADERATTHAPGEPVMRLSDPLQDYAPAGTTVPTFNGQKIKLVELATHTSGLPRKPNLTGITHMQPAQAWGFINGYTLTRAPGQQFLYSNLGFGMLGIAESRKSGKELEQLFRHQISDPLGMNDTMMVLDAQHHALLAQGYAPNGSPAPEGSPGFPAMDGAGALKSTLADQMRYLHYQMGLENTPLNSVLAMMHQRRHAVGANGGVGLAWQMHNLPNGAEILNKDGAMPGYSSFITFVPSSHTGAVVLANQLKCPVGAIANQIVGRLNNALPSEPSPEEGMGEQDQE